MDVAVKLEICLQQMSHWILPSMTSVTLLEMVISV
jgi:hypothetical protein